ncbi:RNA polymerase sigma-70 factor (ECF subfamily) [Wenyingzhuangia heitensis]|uniref:RNA polymerase sigma-70 factor (ECF subfamily) n=1 Tax=Wenyingzhuangia heitensis TaxID=1487859 RepID=A0ABX0U4W7_9FLAO|nr:sigma-70 family RNA polymerase sigma factor [Wenyingzhuangia heitensis]NIJ43903.1 RNA polymerase sigma-70 factor (ECF subfamily) [Wenyingzhuangia heitensis]
MGDLKKTALESFPSNKFERKSLMYNKVDGDLALWQEFQLGSEVAFAKIYKDNVDKLYGYGLKIIYDKNTVKDAIQDLFIDLWDTKEKLSAVKSIKAYLYTSLRRKLIKEHTKHKKRYSTNRDIESIENELEFVEFSLVEKKLFDSERKSLKEGLDSLKPQQREIIYLKYYSRLSYQEIMEIMSLDKKQAYNLLSRTLKSLKDILLFFVLFFVCYMFS